jgi:GPH family glycoside/pentoside/hexuronide:cation symporter
MGDVGNAMVNSAILFFLLVFYTDGVLIAPALAGSALLVGKIYDAVNDPIFGWISDRTRSRFGKRRVYMIFGALPLAVSIVLLWRMPPGMSEVAILA